MGTLIVATIIILGLCAVGWGAETRIGGRVLDWIAERIEG